jgi:hypothetical protein
MSHIEIKSVGFIDLGTIKGNIGDQNYIIAAFHFRRSEGPRCLGGNAFNLALVGATWIFADAIATRHQSVQNQQSTKPSPA